MKKHKIQKEGFTLIEVLMTLAVLGILSATVYANVNGVRERARINGALQFEKGLYSSTGANTNLEFSFEDTVGATVPDRSLNENEATMENGASIGVGMTGSGVVLDGINDHLSISNPFFNELPDNFTASMWVKPTSIPLTNQVFLHSSENGEFMLGYNTLGQFFFSYNGDTTGWNTINSKVFNPGKWHHVAVDWNGEKDQLQLIIDGSSQLTSSIGESLESGSDTPVIGAQIVGGSTANYFEGSIDNVFLYKWN